MAKAYSLDLRERVLAAVAEGLPLAEAAKRFCVSVPSIVRWRALEREGRGVGPKPFAGGRRPARTEAAREAILALLRENPKLSTEALHRSAPRGAGGARPRLRLRLALPLPPAPRRAAGRRRRRGAGRGGAGGGLRPSEGQSRPHDPRAARRPGGTRPRFRLRRALPVPCAPRLQGREGRPPEETGRGRRTRRPQGVARRPAATDRCSRGGGDVLFGGGQAVPRQPGHHRPLARAAALYRRSLTGTYASGRTHRLLSRKRRSPRTAIRGPSLNGEARTAGCYGADVPGSAPFAPPRQAARSGDGPRIGSGATIW